MTTQTGDNFFVIGLPRSRTAWLAAFLSSGNRFCYHEGLNGCPSFKAYRKKVQGVGDSGTALMLFDMNTHFPGAPIVIIERDPAYAIDFCYKTYGYYDPKAIYDLESRLNAIEGLRVHYDDINDRLEDIWTHLIGDGFDRQRADMLIKLDIQVTDPYDFDNDSLQSLISNYRLSS